jgi:hypothetical protein
VNLRAPVSGWKWGRDELWRWLDGGSAAGDEEEWRVGAPVVGKRRESGRIASGRGGDARDGDNRGRGGPETSVPR